jgi:hypothetical protein
MLRLHARLAPVAGTTAAGRFNGTLARSLQLGRVEPWENPRAAARWQLTWKASLPSLSSPASVSLRISAVKGAAPAVRMLCTSCATTAKGAIALTASQASRVANGHAAVVVRSETATLRGAVKVFAVMAAAKPG